LVATCRLWQYKSKICSVNCKKAPFSQDGCQTDSILYFKQEKSFTTMRMLSQGIFRKVLPIVMSVTVVKSRSKEGQRDVIIVEKNIDDSSSDAGKNKDRFMS
jgi:hypothetical protein